MKVVTAIKHLKKGKIVGHPRPLNTWFKLIDGVVHLRFMNHVGIAWVEYGTIKDFRKYESDREFTLPTYGEEFKKDG